MYKNKRITQVLIISSRQWNYLNQFHFRRKKEKKTLTTLAALVVIESPPKKNEPQMMNSKMIAPVEL